jgi:hypothetical protein
VLCFDVVSLVAVFCVAVGQRPAQGVIDVILMNKKENMSCFIFD